MKISKVTVKNYRCLKEFNIELGDYGAFIGPNGSGKSSLLYALKWFFDGGRLSATDVHAFTDENEAARYTDEELQNDPSLGTVEVTVSFSDLTDRDRQKLASYGRGGTATFRRSWRSGEDKDKVVGNAMQGPGFAEVRTMKAVGEFRPAYNALRVTMTDLSDLGARPTKDEVAEALAAWEEDPAHLVQLVSVSDSDASHMFGFNGPNIIKECIRMVLIPAAADIVEEVGVNKKGSALNELIGTLMSTAGAAARQAWIDDNSDAIEELTTSMRESVQLSTGFQAERINERLVELVPNAQVDFNTNVPGWVPNPTAAVRTDVTIDGSRNDVSRQGHGIQRAVMIAMFQSLMPDTKLITGLHEQGDGETEAESKARLQEVLKDIPALVICIEEPEIYQHPVRARAFARVLADLASQPNAQVFIATHSPYFVSPAQFESLRRFYLKDGVADKKHTTIADLVAATSLDEAKIRKTIDMHLPSSFSEGFFSDVVALVEGVTDKTVLEAVAEKIGRPFDSAGVSILGIGGKDGLNVPKVMLDKLGTPAYIVSDGDALGALRKHPSNPTSESLVHGSHRSATETLVAWLPSSTAVFGTLPYSFEGPTVVAKHFTIWNDDIEEELSNWPSFMTALTAIRGQLRDKKNIQAYRETSYV